MACPTRVVMPDNNGKRIPNRIRWLCDVAHIHPSFAAAIRCNVKHRMKKKKDKGSSPDM